MANTIKLKQLDQTQLAAFVNTLILTSGEVLTASRAVVTDGSGTITTSSVTATELGFVSGVTSAIQTQFNNLGSTYLALAGGTMTGPITGASNIVELRNSTNAQTFRVYGTYTDSSNCVRASLSCSTTAVTLTAETAGTGADDVAINLTPSGSAAVTISCAGEGNYKLLNLFGSGSTGSGVSFAALGSGGRTYDLLSTAIGSGAGAGKLAVFDATGGAYRFVLDSPGNVGIGTTSPTNFLSLGGDAARTFWMERRTTASTGYALTVQAGGAKSGETDTAGGDLYLLPGTSTGSAESGVRIQGCVAGASGTTDRSMSTMIQVLGNKIGLFGVTPVIRQTTGIAAATFVANTSAIVDDTATWGGYTAGQIVTALKNVGILI